MLDISIPTERIYLKNFTKHCIYTQEMAMHQCGGKYLFFVNPDTKIEYVVCENCYECYLSTLIKMYCMDCSEVYYSCILSDDYDPNLQAVTWEKYHCNAVIKDCIKCTKCKSKVHLNLKEEKLMCEKCSLKINPDDMMYNCLVCKKDFKSKLKIYNPIEFDIIKISIKNSLLYKVPCKPIELLCCKEQIKNYKTFFHKKECQGILYSGKWINNSIVVCSKCKMLSEIDKFIWTCPICLLRFKAKNSDNNVNQNKIPLPALLNIKNKDNIIQEISNDLSNTNITNSNINNNINIANLNISDKNQMNSCTSATSALSPQLNYILKNRNDFDIENIKIDASKLINVISNMEKGKDLPPNFKRKISIDKNFINRIPGNSNILNNISPTPNNNPVFKYSDEMVDEKINNDLKKESKNVLNRNIKNHMNDLSPNNRNLNFFLEEAKKVESQNNNGPNCVGEIKQNNINPAEILNLGNKYDSKEEENLQSFNFEEFKIIMHIGEGSFGKIYLVEDEYKQQFSMKKIIANDELDVENFTQEYELVNKVRHKNILRIHSICRRQLDSTTYALYILMEKGVTDWEKEIKARQNQKKYYSEKELFNILRQLTDALAFLQIKNISHRDIKPQNVLLFKEGIFKIADFGEAKKISLIETSKQLSTLRGTELYMSPLLFNGLRTGQNDIKHNSFKSDVFSLGFCLLYSATLSIHCLYELRRETDNFNIGFKLSRFIKARYSQNISNILLRMLDVDEEKRCDFIELQSLIREIKL